MAFLVSVDLRMLAPVLPSIAASLSATAGQVGLAMTAYALTYGGGQLVYGPLSDRLGRLTVVRVAGLGFTAATLLSAAAATTSQFVVARLVTGAFAGAVIPLTLVYIGDTVEYARRQATLGRFSIVTSAAMALSASIGGTIAYLVSWRVMLLGYGLLALVPTCLMWSCSERGRDNAGGTTAPATSFAEILADPRARRVYLAVFFEGFLVLGAVTYLGAFATTRHALDQLTVGLLIALFGVGVMTVGASIGMVRRRLSEGGLAMVGALLIAAAFAGLVPRWPWPTFGISMFVLGAGFVSLHTTLQLRGTELSPTARGKAFALFVFSLFTGTSAGTATLGRLVDAGHYDAMFIVGAAGLILVGAATASAPRAATDAELASPTAVGSGERLRP
jgi:predicted MFS family arabinose efflux permease